MIRNDGGPAFPVDCNWQDGVPTSGVQTSSKTGMATGMTMRDYFAIHADRNDIAVVLSEHPHLSLTQARFFYADAMLATRGEQ